MQLAHLSEKRASELEVRLHEQEMINKDMMVGLCRIDISHD